MRGSAVFKSIRPYAIQKKEIKCFDRFPRSNFDKTFFTSLQFQQCFSTQKIFILNHFMMVSTTSVVIQLIFASAFILTVVAIASPYWILHTSYNLYTGLWIGCEFYRNGYMCSNEVLSI